MGTIEPIVLGGMAATGTGALIVLRALRAQLQGGRSAPAQADAQRNLVLGRDVVFQGQEMGVTVGSVGSGKFVAAIAPNLLAYQGSCFVIDPKGEVCAVTAHARATTLEQKVHRLDPFNATRFDPKSVPIGLASFNPLDALDPTEDSIVSDAGTLASAIIVPKPEVKDPFWQNSARELLTALLIFTKTHPEAEGKRNLATVLEFLSASPERWQALHREMEESSFAVVRNCSTALRSQSDTVFSGVVQQARSEMGFATFPEIERTMATSSFALSELFTAPTTIYLVLPAGRLESHKQWLRLMVAASLLGAGRFKRSEVETPVLWIIDEAARLGTMEDIPKAYGLMRGYGVRVWSFWQDLGQLKACYPHDWSSIMANSFNQVLAVGDLESAKYFGEMAGTMEVSKVSHSTSDSQSRGPLGFLSRPDSGTSQGSSISYSTQREAVIPPERLLQMSPDLCYIRLPGQAPRFVPKLRYFEVPELNERAMGNPYHTRF